MEPNGTNCLPGSLSYDQVFLSTRLEQGLFDVPMSTRGKALKVPGTVLPRMGGARDGLRNQRGRMEPPVVPFFWVLRQAGRPWFAPLYGRSRATLAAARPVGSSGLLEVQAKSTGAVPGLG